MKRSGPERWGARQLVHCSDCGRQLIGRATILMGFYRLRHHRTPDGTPCRGGMGYAAWNVHPFACPWPKPNLLDIPNHPRTIGGPTP